MTARHRNDCLSELGIRLLRGMNMSLDEDLAAPALWLMNNRRA
jgi:hypothetical protein